MATTHVSLTYGEKELDCELSFTPPYMLHVFSLNYIPQDCEFTLEKVSIVCKPQLNFDGKKSMEVTHLEDISELLQFNSLKYEYNQWVELEQKAIDAIMDRGYV